MLEPYDSDKLIPTYGFGGIPNYMSGSDLDELKDCFPLNGNIEDP